MEATKGAGAFHVVEKPFEPDEVLGLRQERARAPQAGRSRTPSCDAGWSSRPPTARSSASAPGIQRVMETIASVADTDANVLIVGESGTGKELIANALHERSARARRPLDQDQLRGAAEGPDRVRAVRPHQGRRSPAPPPRRSACWRRRTRARCCSTRSPRCRSTCRPSCSACWRSAWCAAWAAPSRSPSTSACISSTNRSPEQAVKDGQLRQDLYFRINTVTIAVPPLRERREDLPMLVRAFLDRYRAKHQRAGGRDRARGLPPPARVRRGRATCASCSTPSSARCWSRAGASSRSATCRSRCSTAAARAALGGCIAPSEVPSGSLEEIERASILKALDADALEQAGRRRAARPAAPDALLEDAQAQHPAARP